MPRKYFFRNRLSQVRAPEGKQRPRDLPRDRRIASAFIV